MRRVCIVLAVAVAVAGCSTDPRGTRLDLRTANGPPPASVCEQVPTAPFRIGRVGAEMTFVDAATGERRAIIWPYGFAAWLEFDMAVLYASDGKVVGREGDVLDTILGGGVAGEGFRVCGIGARPFQ